MSRRKSAPTALRRATTAAAALAGAGVAGVAYAAVEARSYRLRRATAPVLAPGSAPLRVLHVSDLHMTPGDAARQEWVRSLDRLDPHLVVDTGDHLAHAAAVPGVLRALEPLLRRPGAFVLGSNDYYAPEPANPARYLRGPSKEQTDPTELPWRDLVAALRGAGWADLTNARGRLVADGRTVDLVGVDDPHLRRDRYLRLSRRFSGAPGGGNGVGSGGPDVGASASGDGAADLSLGVAHAPYRRVLDAMTADGLDLLLAGHTHGGQLCVPGYGALVTNCDLPRSHVKGLHRWSARGTTTWLHVSAGVGTSPYAPVRFACPPEATLLTLVPRG